MVKQTIKDRMVKCWNCFNEMMDSLGYRVFTNSYGKDYCPSLPLGSRCSKNDKYVPIIQLTVHPLESSLWLLVTDRNGNAFLDGNTVAIYEVDCSKPEFEKAFDKMLKDTIEKFGGYCKENKLQFDVDEQEIERKSCN
jgi:hypothetical protein